MDTIATLTRERVEARENARRADAGWNQCLDTVHELAAERDRLQAELERFRVCSCESGAQASHAIREADALRGELAAEREARNRIARELADRHDNSLALKEDRDKEYARAEHLLVEAAMLEVERDDARCALAAATARVGELERERNGLGDALQETEARLREAETEGYKASWLTKCPECEAATARTDEDGCCLSCGTDTSVVGSYEGRLDDLRTRLATAEGRVAELVAALERSVAIIETWHRVFLASPARCKFDRHDIGTTDQFPGFSCEGCTTHSQARAALATTDPSGLAVVREAIESASEMPHCYGAMGLEHTIECDEDIATCRFCTAMRALAARFGTPGTGEGK
jgi:hypothetical protein